MSTALYTNSHNNTTSHLESYNNVPNQVRTLQQLADSLAEIGHIEEAISTYTSIIRFYGNLDFAVDPDLIRQVRQARVECYLKLGMTEEVEHEMALLMMTPSSSSSSSEGSHHAQHHPAATTNSGTSSSSPPGESTPLSSRFSSALRRGLGHLRS